jgi:histidinol-phosphate aminotransferase
MLAFLTFFQQDQPILFPDITYSFYHVYCNFLRIQAKTIPVTADFRIRIGDYTQPNGGIILANPNAMTGRCVTLQEIETLLMTNAESVVAVDEAYVDFGAETAISLIKTSANLLIIQTLSKSRALAGLRIGFALGSEELIEGLERAKNSFNSYTLDRLAIAGGVAAMQDEAYFRDVCHKIMATRTWLTAELAQLGVKVVPSQANFLFMQHDKVSGKRLYEALRKQGILVRYFDKPRVSNFIRVSIGTDAEMRTFVEKVRQTLRET